MEQRLLPIVVFDKFFIHCWHNSFASIALLNKSYWGWLVKNSYNYMYDSTPELDKFNWKYSWFNCYRTDNVFEELSKTLKIDFYDCYGDIEKLIISNINEDKYIFLLCDNYYLKGHRDYRQTHYQNFLLIYGYNNMKRKYEVLTDYNIKNKLERFQVSYESLLDSKLIVEKRRLKIKEFEKNIAIIEKIDDDIYNNNYELDISDVYKNIVNILETKKIGNTYKGIYAIKKLSHNLMQLFDNSFESNNTLIEGLASSFLMAYFTQIGNLYLDKFLYGKGYIEKAHYETMNEKFKELMKNWNVLEILTIKYMLLPKSDVLIRVKKRLDLVYDKELETLQLFEKILRPLT